MKKIVVVLIDSIVRGARNCTWSPSTRVTNMRNVTRDEKVGKEERKERELWKNFLVFLVHSC